MKIMFTDEDMSQIMIDSGGDISVVAYPPVSEEDKKIVEEYGGDYEIRRTTVDYTRDAEAYYARLEQYEANVDSLGIKLLLDDLSKAELMSLKMNLFKRDEVKACKDKELMTKLRKSNDSVEAIMYYGMIRCAVSSAE